MKHCLTLLFVVITLGAGAQQRFQLSRPLVNYKSLFFSDSATLELKFAQPGATIYYATDNRFPTEVTAGVTKPFTRYKKPLLLKEPFTTVQTKVMGKGFEPSETITLSFAKEGKKIASISATAPNPKYPGSGDSTLFDNRGGIENISSGTWMGYNTDSVHLFITLKEKQPVNTVLLSFLQNEPSWIFLPEQIMVYYFNETQSAYIPFGKEVLFNEAPSGGGMQFRFITAKTGPATTQKLFIDIRPVKKMPAWHPAKGEHAWCFIDEIKVY